MLQCESQVIGFIFSIILLLITILLVMESLPLNAIVSFLLVETLSLYFDIIFLICGS